MSRSIEFRVASSPSTSEAKTNLLYISDKDPNLNAISKSKLLKINNFYYSWNTHPDVIPGTVGLSVIQRRCLDFVMNQTFIAKLGDFSIPKATSMTLEVDYFVKAHLRRQIGDIAFNLFLLLEIYDTDYYSYASANTFDSKAVQSAIHIAYVNQVFSLDQMVLSEFSGYMMVYYVKEISVAPSEGSDFTLTNVPHGSIDQTTQFALASRSPNLKLTGSSMSISVFKPNFNFENFGVGGLDKEFATIFRRAFASRVFPPSTLSKLGIKPIKGLLLYGPPGTGKTLMARQIGKMLNGKEPKIVNGPDILSKYVGESEKNVRELFADAEQEWLTRGEQSDLHIIVMDELDAVCKERGSRSQGGTGVGDSIVNQLLSKMDGYAQIDNLLIIGMTNRKDMIDEALLRPGRLEVHIEISLPDELGRLQILKIHTAAMRDSRLMSDDVDLQYLAQITKNYSGAEISGLVRTAASYALTRQIDMKTPTHATDPDKVCVRMDDFERALTEIKPAFGVNEKDLMKCLLNNIIYYNSEFSNIMSQCKLFIEQVRNSSRTPLISFLLEGLNGVGKTAIAAKMALDSHFPFVQIISSEEMIGYSESKKVFVIRNIFENAYRSPLSLIIIDDVERLIEFVRIGPRFSNVILQMLLVLLKRMPPANRKLVIIGTTSNKEILNELEILQAFDSCVNIPAVSSADGIAAILEACNYGNDEISRILPSISNLKIPVKRLIMVAEMAKQASDGLINDRFMYSLVDYF